MQESVLAFVHTLSQAASTLHGGSHTVKGQPPFLQVCSASLCGHTLVDENLQMVMLPLYMLT